MAEPAARLLSAEELERIRRLTIGRLGLSQQEQSALWDHLDALTERLQKAEAREGRLVWSREVPTVAGWYWEQSLACDLGIMEIYTVPSEPGSLFILGLPVTEYQRKYLARWAGPIPEPAALASEPLPAETQP